MRVNGAYSFTLVGLSVRRSRLFLLHTYFASAALRYAIPSYENYILCIVGVRVCHGGYPTIIPERF